MLTAKSSALKAVRPYRCLLGCNLSPAFRSYVNSCLRQTGQISPIPVDSRSLPMNKKMAWRTDGQVCSAVVLRFALY
jgi:hypothetical protein